MVASAGGHGERIAAERSGLIDGAERREQIHEDALAAEDADGQASADDFSQRDEVGVEPVELQAPPRATRKPVMTSSTMSRAPGER